MICIAAALIGQNGFEGEEKLTSTLSSGHEAICHECLTMFESGEYVPSRRYRSEAKYGFDGVHLLMPVTLIEWPEHWIPSSA